MQICVFLSFSNRFSMLSVAVSVLLSFLLSKHTSLDLSLSFRVFLRFRQASSAADAAFRVSSAIPEAALAVLSWSDFGRFTRSLENNSV